MDLKPHRLAVALLAASIAFVATIVWLWVTYDDAGDGVEILAEMELTLYSGDILGDTARSCISSGFR